MKNILSNIIGLTFAMLLFSSCSKELQNTNINPNNLENPDATTLLSNTIVSLFYNNASIAWTLGNGYNQQATFSQSYYNQPSRYQPVTNEPYWNILYETARDANTLYNLGVKQKNTLLQAASLTLRSYAFAQLTELWGDIPFTQALQGASGTFSPKYDGQQTVYTDAQAGILPSLKRADSLLKANPSGLIGGDVVFNSNTTLWRHFINALRLRYLLRVSSKMSVSSEMQSILSDGAIMQSASESGTLALPTVIPYNFVSLSERSGDFQVKYMNTLLYNTFINTQDTARISSYFTTNSLTASNSPFSFNNYGGLPIVVDATTTQAAQASNFNGSFTSGTNSALIKARIITYAEQQFILAEAALKGYIIGSTQAYYNSGIIGAFAEIGISAPNAINYLTHTNVIFDNTSVTNALNQIITQKWLANINNSFEGWVEFRRTGIPALATGGNANLNNGNIATRFLYPTSEKSINSTNYSSEIQQMGGSEITTYKAWWEK